MENLWILILVSGVYECITQEVTVRLTPDVAVAVEGQPFYWNCIVTTSNVNQAYSIRWLSNNDYIVNDARRRLLSNGTLTWLTVASQDEGAYYCEVTAGNNVTRSQVAALRLAYLATTFTIEPTSQFKRLGENVTLTCSIYSLPAATLSWQTQSGPVSSGTQVRVNDMRSELRLTSLTYNDEGSYTCRAGNNLLRQTRVTQPAVLVIEGEPQWQVQPSGASRKSGESVLFDCFVRAIPPATVTWYRTITNTRIQGDDVKYSVYVNGSLRIWNLQQQDGGQYTCTAANTWGQLSQTILLTVDDKGGVLQFSQKPNDTDIVEGRSVTWYCEAPGASIAWARVLGELPAGRTDFPYSGALRIINIQTGDAGTYRCVATAANAQIVHDVQLRVRVGPWFRTVPTDTTVQEGQVLTMNCSVEGDPTPSLYWTLPSGVTVSSQSPTTRAMVTNGTLQVSSVTPSDAGPYACVATNMVATVSVTVGVYVIYGPVFIRAPQDIDVTEGQTAMLNCAVSGYPTPRIDWFYGTEPIRTGIQSNGSLVIDNIQRSRDGSYLCQAVSQTRKIYAMARVFVNVAPKMASFITELVVDVGDNLMLHCVFDGTPTPTARWTRDGNQPLTLAANMVLWSNYTLQFSAIKENQFGVYKCLASNKAGDAELSYTIYRKDFPTFIIRPANLTANVTKKLEIPCTAKADDVPTISWYRLPDNARPVPITDAKSRVHVDYHGTLLFEEVEITDEGWYQCVARNSLGNVSAAIYLDLRARPQVTVYPTQLTIMQMKPFQLSCKAPGRALTTWQWASPLAVATEGVSTVGDTLVVSRTSANVVTDYGTWICTACNILGCSQASTVVRVQGLPVLLEIRGYENMTEGSVVIQCLGRGFPDPDITYYLQNLPISATTPPAGHRVMNNMLYIQKTIFDPTLRYSCGISNSYGSSVQSLTQPNAPRNIQVTSQNTSLTFTWDKVDVLPVPVTYAVVYERVASLGQVVSERRVRQADGSRTVTVGSPPYNLTGLEPYSSYRVAMTASNIMGTSGLSPSLLVNTTQGRAEAPQDLRVTYHGGRVQISWSPPLRLNAPPENIRYMTVYHDDTRNTPLMTRTIDNKPPFLEFLDNVLYGIQLRVTVMAVNIVNNLAGLPASQAITTTEAAPQVTPTIIKAVPLNKSSVYLEWKVAGDSAAINGFMVRYQAEGTGRDLMDTLEGSSRVSYMLGNLAEGGTYTISIAAFNSGGVGRFSGPRTVSLAIPAGNTDDSTRGGSTLSLGEVIAIIVGCFAFIIILVLLIALCCYAMQRERRKTREKEVESIYSDTKRRVMYNNVGLSDSSKARSTDGHVVYGSQTHLTDPELLLMARDLYGASDDGSSYNGHSPYFGQERGTGSSPQPGGHVYAEVRKPGNTASLKVSEIPDVPVDGTPSIDGWVKRVSPQDLDEQPRVIGGHKSHGSSESHGYNSQSESDGLPWVEPYVTARSSMNVSQRRSYPDTAWHPDYALHNFNNSQREKRDSRKINFEDDPGSPASARPTIHGEMYMKGQEPEDGIANPLYQRRDSSAAVLF